jgi:hypothetical protein
MLDRAARAPRWTAFALLSLSALAAAAQTPQTPPPAAAPAAPAEKPCSAPENRQFDFWVGNWEVKNPEGGMEGTNDITSIQGGCAIQEHWDDGHGMTGTSFNMYEPGTHKWHQTWVDNAGGILLLSGSFTGGKMILEGDTISKGNGKAIANRITWTPTDANHVRQFWEVSRDGGKTWMTNFDGRYTRK